jgi:hypothetical protein
MGQRGASKGWLGILTALSVELERYKHRFGSRLANVGDLFLDLSFDITPFGIRVIVRSRVVRLSCPIQFGSVLSQVSVSASAVMLHFLGTTNLLE